MYTMIKTKGSSLLIKAASCIFLVDDVVRIMSYDVEKNEKFIGYKKWLIWKCIHCMDILYKNFDILKG